MTSPARPACGRPPRGSPTGTRCCASWRRESASMPVGWLPRYPPSPARAGAVDELVRAAAAPVRAAVEAVRVVRAAIAREVVARETAGQEMAWRPLVLVARDVLRRAGQTPHARGRAVRDVLRRADRARLTPVVEPRVPRPSRRVSPQVRARAPDARAAAVALRDRLTARLASRPDWPDHGGWLRSIPATSRIWLSNSQPRSPIRHLAGDERTAFPSGALGRGRRAIPEWAVPRCRRGSMIEGNRA